MNKIHDLRAMKNIIYLNWKCPKTNYSLILEQTDATIQVGGGANLHSRIDNGSAQACVIKVRTVTKK